MSDSSVQWSIDFVSHYMQSNLPETFKILKLSDADKVLNAIEEYSQRNNGQAMPRSLLFRHVVYSLRDYHRIENAIKLALTMDMVEMQEVQGGKRYAVYTGVKRQKDLDAFTDQENPEVPKEVVDDDWNN